MRTFVAAILASSAVLASQLWSGSDAALPPGGSQSPGLFSAALGSGGHGPEGSLVGAYAHYRQIGNALHADPSLEVSDEALTTVVRRLCVTCHNDQLRTADLSLGDFDVQFAADQGEISEKIISKLRLNMMPPPGIPRPGGDTLVALAETLERKMDEARAADPNPGNRPFQRLNQPEYERAIRELLGLEIDAGAFLPPDTRSRGFDNFAAVQLPSPTVMESYLNAASEISRMALGDESATTRSAVYTVPRTQSQTVRVEGAPHGTRGGTSVLHTFPVDGEYQFDVTFLSGLAGGLYGRSVRDETVEVSINGERVALIEVDRFLHESEPWGRTRSTDPIFVPAGQHRVSAAFLQTFEGPEEDLVPIHRQSAADLEADSAYGLTILPHLRELVIQGPLTRQGVSETPSRERILTCRPASVSDERICAEEIVSRLASQAYRRPLTDRDMEELMSLFEIGRDRGGDFEAGVRTALQGILSSVHFLFRIERPQGEVDSKGLYRITDLDLATRLSFFLWGSPPDDVLLDLALSQQLSDPQILRDQVVRMMTDPRSEALSTRFATQWLRLQDLDRVFPDSHYWPDFDTTLRAHMRTETQMLFQSIVDEDRPILDLLTAEHTFVNADLARHYGIPGVAGDHFRKVMLPEDNPRRGLGILGHGSILVQTSVANRTSPVLRGLWMMEVLLHSPPPPPPPNVPDLETTEATSEGRNLTVAERLAIHRANPTCNACHQFIDPMGVPLENFDVDGKWRIRDGGTGVQAVSQMWDGSKLDGPESLRDALLSVREPILRAFTTDLLAYALGRRVEYFDMPLVREIVRSASEDDYRMSSFVLGVVLSEPFQTKRDPTLAVQDREME